MKADGDHRAFITCDLIANQSHWDAHNSQLWKQVVHIENKLWNIVLQGSIHVISGMSACKLISFRWGTK